MVVYAMLGRHDNQIAADLDGFELMALQPPIERAGCERLAPRDA